MKALDTNILIYAYIASSPFHQTARQLLEELINGQETFLIPYPCIHEFLSISTHPKVYNSSLDQAFNFLDRIKQSQSLFIATEGQNHFELLKAISVKAHLNNGKIHDARIAAICLSHGVDVLYTADRDFSIFPDLQTSNPLID